MLYVWLAPAHVVDGDNAEFSLLGATGGAAHPSGYPLYVLYLRAMRWLPGSSPAHTAALATAVLAALSIVVLHAAARAWGARPVAASLACAIFAGAPVILGMYTEAEVFALNGLVVGGVLCLAAKGGPLTGYARAGALGLVAGLGLSNHLTCALVGPIGLLGLARGAREARRPPLALALAAGGFVLGLTPYLYLLVERVHEGTWGNQKSLSDVVGMFLRREYGGPGAFAGNNEQVAAIDSLGALVWTLARTWWFVPPIAGLVFAVLRIVRPRIDGETRIAWACWLTSFVVAGPLLVTRFDVPPEGVGRYVVARFHILPALLLAIPIAGALTPLVTRMRTAALGHGLAFALFAGAAGTSLQHVLHVHAPAVEDQALSMLRALPEHAVVIGMDDDLAAGTLYAQEVLHVRPDVDYVHRPQFGSDWYRDRLRARGFKLDDLIDDLHAKGRPVFVQGSEKDVLAQLPHYRWFILFRVLPRDQPVPSLDEVIAINKAVYEKLVIDYERPGMDDEWATVIHNRYARTWRALGGELMAAGREADAHAALNIADTVGPRP
jgi:hypothetical protein